MPNIQQPPIDAIRQQAARHHDPRDTPAAYVKAGKYGWLPAFRVPERVGGVGYSTLYVVHHSRRGLVKGCNQRRIDALAQKGLAVMNWIGDGASVPATLTMTAAGEVSRG